MSLNPHWVSWMWEVCGSSKEANEQVEGVHERVAQDRALLLVSECGACRSNMTYLDNRFRVNHMGTTSNDDGPSPCPLDRLQQYRQPR